eukprot:215921_1
MYMIQSLIFVIFFFVFKKNTSHTMAHLQIISLLFILSLTRGVIITPTSTNGDTEYYITSQSGAFTNNSIICTTLTCIITCDNPHNCSRTSIDASLSTTLIIDCNEYESCHYMNVSAGPSNTININCLFERACASTTFNMDSTINVNINCSHTGSNGPSDGACTSATFNAKHSTNVYATCYNKYEWNYATFNVNHADTVFISASKTLGYSAHQTIILATGVTNELTINCTGKFACRRSSIYCPANGNCNIYCNEGNSACRDIDLFISNNHYALLNLQCSTDATYNCHSLLIECQDTGLTTHYEWYATKYICLELDNCCPPGLQSGVNIINCAADSDCFINCTLSGCVYKTTINATLANTLTIICTHDYECMYLNIICPHEGICKMHCLASEACSNVDILSATVQVLDIKCPATKSCYNLDIIDLIVTDTVNITCSGIDSCYYADWRSITITGEYFYLWCIDNQQSCRRMDIFIIGKTDVTNIFISATSLETLLNIEIDIENAKTFNMNCIAAQYDDRPCYDMTKIIARNIGTINIICDDYRACWSSDWEFSANDITFFCNGELSCQQSTIQANINKSISITTADASALVSSNVDIFCKDCMNTYNCLENITIFCGFNQQPYTIDYGDQCRNCLCDVSVMNEWQHVAFTENIWQQCIPTMEPTIDPTISPSFNPSTIPTI